MRRRAIALTIAASAIFAGLGAFAQSTKEKEKKEITLTFEVYKDAKGEFRWRLKSSNGQAIASSGEGYKAKADCLHGIDLIKEGAAKAKTDDQT
jgi:uncharacterized protein YegP (UPF0339 family)